MGRVIYDLLRFTLKHGARAFWLLMPLWLWLLARHVSGDFVENLGEQYPPRSWLAIHLDRLSATATVLGPALILAAVTALHVLRLAERRMMHLAAVGLMASAAWSAWGEYARLATYRNQYSWLQLLPFIDAYLAWGCVAAITLSALPYGFLRNKTIRALWQRGPEIDRADSALHGAAAWMPTSELKEVFGTGGIVVGEAYRVDQDVPASRRRFEPRDPSSWGKGGTQPLLRYDGVAGNGHAMLIAGSGGYKTTAVGVPTSLEWHSSLVYLDPSCEVGPIVAAARLARGRKVVLLDPSASVGFNALSWINPDSPSVQTDIQAVATWLMGEKSRSKGAESGGGHAYFDTAAKGLIEVLLAQIIFSSLPVGEKTLKLLRERLAIPMDELQKRLSDLVETPPHPVVAQLAATLVGMAPEQWSGVYGTAAAMTQWLSTPSLAGLVSGTDFDLADLVAGTLDVFIQIPLKVLAATPAVARVVVGALLNAVYEADGGAPRVLFMLDEVYQLGFMQALERARDTGRKYGISLFMMYQSVGQIVDQWGKEGKRAWYDSTTWRAYACVQDLDSAKEVSEICGTFTALQEAENEGEGTSLRSGQIIGGTRSGNKGKSLTPVKRNLINPDEILQSMREDEQIIIMRGHKPIRTGRAMYFRRPEMLRLVARNRFAA
jgi:type IV secretion system protein VirD4